MRNPLIIALPSKGRLEEPAKKYFERAGLPIERGVKGRQYRGSLSNIEGVEISYLSASEIVGALQAGDVHFGITGEDLLREQLPIMEERIEILTGLGFGNADVVVAVPQSWIDVTTMSDLSEIALEYLHIRGKRLRCATKYSHLAGDFFARHHIDDYRLVESSGATEGAPAAGSADCIIDISSSGATLSANSLKILDDGMILRSEASLCAAVKASWSGQMELVRMILSRLGARQQGLRHIELRFESNDKDRQWLPALLKEKAARFSFGEAQGGICSLLCPQSELANLCKELHLKGKKTIIASKADYIFEAQNRLYEKLTARL